MAPAEENVLKLLEIDFRERVDKGLIFTVVRLRGGEARGIFNSLPDFSIPTVLFSSRVYSTLGPDEASKGVCALTQWVRGVCPNLPGVRSAV